MRTTCVNVKVANIRPEYDNLKEWMNDKDHVYIGRIGVVFIDGQRYPPQDSIWANPFKINSQNDRYDVLKKYKEYIIDKLESRQISYRQLLKLRGKVLGCWCKPEPCHGDILIKLLKDYYIPYDKSKQLRKIAEPSKNNPWVYPGEKIKRRKHI